MLEFRVLLEHSTFGPGLVGYRTGIGFNFTGKNTEECGFAGAIWTNKGHMLSCPDFETCTIQHGLGAKIFTNPFNIQQNGHGRFKLLLSMVFKYGNSTGLGVSKSPGPLPDFLEGGLETEFFRIF